MSVASEATEVIASVIGDDPLADVAADKLEERGLLAPDTPEPDGTRANGNTVWRADRCLTTIAARQSNQVRMSLLDMAEVRYSPQDARQQAYMLLAAANHAEGAEQ